MVIGKIRIRSVRMRTAYPKVAGYINIPAYSKGHFEWRPLSPFIIGPVEYEENKQAQLFENFWQGHKVWPQHIDATTGEPNEAWYEWHADMMNHDVAIRRPFGHTVPSYAWWRGQKLGVVEARKQLYIPFLQRLYRAHPTYQWLCKMVEDGKDIIILEPDGPPQELYPDGLEVNLDTLRMLQNVTRMKDSVLFAHHREPNKYVPYGHGYVIALTLLEDLE